MKKLFNSRYFLLIFIPISFIFTLIYSWAISPLFLGDGVEPCRKAIAERLGERACFAPAQHLGLRAASACALAAEYAKDEANLKDCMTLLPLYLRAPQAERERAAKLAAQKEA